MKILDLKLDTKAPEGIVNPADLNNGWFDRKIPWDDRFIDRLIWAGEQFPKAVQGNLEVIFRTDRTDGPNPQWADTRMFFFNGARLYEMDPGRVIPLPGGLSQWEEEVSSAIKELANGLTIQLPRYPGFEARNGEGSPLGPIWPDHRLSKPPNQRVIYHVSDAELKNPRYSPGALFYDELGNSYSKQMSREFTPGKVTGMFWGSWVETYYWQREFSVKG